MINPVYLPVGFILGIVFGLFIKKSHHLSIILLLLIFLFTGITPFITFWKIYFHHVTPSTTTFLGVEIPQILMNVNKALLVSLTNIFGLFSGLYLISYFEKKSLFTLLSFLLFFLSINLIILTNSFYVFCPAIILAVVSFYGTFYTVFDYREKKNFILQLLTAISLISIGILGIVLHSGVGEYSSITQVSGLYVVLLLLGFIILFTLFPVLPWIKSGISTEKSIFILLFQVLFLSACFYVFFILSQLINDIRFNNIFAILGMLTYFSASFLATGQVSLSKMLGFSTSAQFGLMIAMVGLSRYLGMDVLFITITLLITHFIAKAGIILVTGSIQQDNISKWSVLKRSPVILFLLGVFIFALAGMPPFPSFYARWQFIQHMVDYHMYDWLIFFALAFLFESYYLFRWLSSISKKGKSTEYLNTSGFDICSGIIVFALLIVASTFTLAYTDGAGDLRYDLLIMVLFIYLLSFIPPAAQLFMAISFLINPIWQFHLDSFTPQSITIGVFALLSLTTLLINYKKHRFQTALYAIVLLIYSSVVAFMVSRLWSSLLVWSLLFIAGLYLYLINKEKVKENALFVLLILTIAVAIMWVGLISGIPMAQQPKIGSFSWISLPAFSKTMIIIGSVITLITSIILMVLGIKQKSQRHVVGYFSFRNVLAESIDRLLYGRSVMIFAQLISIVLLFIFLWYLS